MAGGLPSALRRLYLSIYNWTVFFGWLQVLVLAVKTLHESGHEHVYSAVERPLQLAQTAAILETQKHIMVSSLVISWSITEIIRYSFFGMKETLGFTPSWLLWLRYSTFLLLYPTGIASEVGLIYIALPYIKRSEKYCVRMPNKWNYSFDYFYAAILALGIYVPGGPHMYSYMLGQRKKALAKSKRE
ncbi:very-long-chain (3R)-3-hydroxyacyl-CoA dehydratase PASTICCINO 2A isoform X2 [Rhodamnia argentea]|uniref:Very-long-chain (3R)-3-hydroxyacyl-CoA dehydratase n=1 Tax=Rhodamnia argentea TaxID=178133 RepID=A0A8B8NGI2_9MYRT|nr:very-long-chain (3R)-3-hydroxyacyl-CoA dehydratase PASTICCINO 2A isoform X2 [Rhodamnia argentea]